MENEPVKLTRLLYRGTSKTNSKLNTSIVHFSFDHLINGLCISTYVAMLKIESTTLHTNERL